LKKDDDAETVLKGIRDQLLAEAGDMDLKGFTVPQQVRILQKVAAEKAKMKAPVQVAPAARPADPAPPKARVPPKTLAEENDARAFVRQWQSTGPSYAGQRDKLLKGTSNPA
jgi:hypothetical protein